MTSNKASIIFILLFTLCNISLGQQDSLQDTLKSTSQETATRYLHIATNPSTVDLYTGTLQPDFASRPSYVSPAFIPVSSGDDNVTVSFFHPDYADTTINIKLSKKDTSFIIVALRQTYDEETIENNQKLMKHRNKRILGSYLRWASIAPFTISGISAIVSLYNISKAKDHKKAMEHTHFMNEKYDEHKMNFKDHKGSAQTAKTVSGIFFFTGLTFLTAGFVLSF